jgi:hypothetical protein
VSKSRGKSSLFDTNDPMRPSPAVRHTARSFGDWHLKAMRLMKAIFSSIASLLLVVLVSIWPLVGQLSASGKGVHTASLRSTDDWLQINAQFSNAGRSLVERSAIIPDAAGVLPATFLSATWIESDGTATDQVVRGDFYGDGLSVFVTVIHLSTPSLTYLGVVLNGRSLSFISPILTPVKFAAGDLILVADANSDGRDDVILVHPSSMDVFISMGDGAFTAPQSVVSWVGMASERIPIPCLYHDSSFLAARALSPSWRPRCNVDAPAFVTPLTVVEGLESIESTQTLVRHE